MVGVFATGVDDGVFRYTLLVQRIVVRALIGQCGGDEEFLYGILVFAVKIVELAGADGEETTRIPPRTVIRLITERAQIGDVSCGAVQAAVKGEAPMIIELLAQVERWVEE